MHLTHLMWESPAALTNSPCIGDGNSILDYATVESRAAAFAEQLKEHGIGRGDVIAIMLENSPEVLIAILGAWLVEAAATPVNPTFTEREARYQLEDSCAKLVLTTEAPDGSAQSPKVLDIASMRHTPRRSTGRPTIDPGQIALLIYTSGSTGRPKGVMLDHANLAAMTTQWAGHVGMTATDRSLLAMPLFHVNALCMSWLAPMSVGGSTVVLRRFNPEPFLEAIARWRPTYFSAVPAILARLVELPAEMRPDTSSIRFVLCGAAPASVELLSRAADRFGFRIIEGYGLTEATCASACNPLQGPHRLGTVGPAIAGQRIRVTDTAGRTVPTGERGEVRISGPTVMRGYLGKPEATAETVVDGWLRTGDIGILDEDGYLRIVDRIKDMIIRGGENLYPKEIEQVLTTHPDVVEAAVVGGAHEKLGEVPVAYVCLRAGSEASADELLEHCARSLTKIKVPSHLEIVDTLPRNPVGKIDKPELRRRTTPFPVPTPA